MQRAFRSSVIAVSAITAVTALASGGTALAAGGTRQADPLTHPEQFSSPPAAVRPKMRWWWGSALGAYTGKPFGALTEAETRREVEALRAAGFGGTEIAFNAQTWANASQRENLQAALEEGGEEGLEVDMTMGSSWPVKTPTTAPGTGLSSQELQYGRRDVAAGEAYTGAIPAPFDDPTNARKGTLVAVTAARVEAPGPAVTTPDEPPAASTVLASSSLVDLTDRVSSDGTSISWTAPDDGATWILFGFWARDSTQGVMDHFDGDAARAAAGYIDDQQFGSANTALFRRFGGSLFEDSLEINAAGLFWTPRMAQQFERRRGYAMARYLPLMFQQGMNKYWVPETAPPADFDLPGDGGARIRHDYYETLTDLYVDEHIKPFADWASDHGVRYRTQAGFGQDLDSIRSAREVAKAGGLADDESLNAGDNLPYDLSNTGKWRFALDHHRTVSSGSFQGGSTEVTSELGAVFNEAYGVGQADLKGMMDKEWAGGSSRPMVHGLSYQSDTASWPGDANFANAISDGWNDRTFPQWAMWKPLTDYWARGTYVLQSGTPKTDVAVYRDGFLTTAAQGQTNTETLKPLFDALGLERRGFSLGYVDPAGLTEGAAAGDGVLYPDGPGYRTLIIDERALPADAAEAIADQAEKGLAVVLVGTLPDRGTSYADRAAGDVRVRRAVDRILQAPRVARVAAQTDAAGALERIGVRPDAAWLQDQQVYSQHRRTADADYYYLYNATNDRVTWDASFASSGRPYTMDLWTGDVTPVAAFDQAGGRTTLRTTLVGRGTTVVAFKRGEAAPARHVVSTSAATALQRDADAVELRDTEGGTHEVRLSDGADRRVDLPPLPAPLSLSAWKLHLVEERPGAPVTHDLDLDGLQDWRTLPGLANAAGTGTYTTTVDVAEGWTAGDRGALLRLGDAQGSVRVAVNGDAVGNDTTGRSDIDVSALLRPGANEIRVVLASTLRNRIAVTDPNTLFGTKVTTKPSGLLGPVQLVPYGRATVDLRPAPAAATTPSQPTPGTPVPGSPAKPGAASSAVRLSATRTARSSTLRRRGILVTVRTPRAGRLRLTLSRAGRTWARTTRTVSRPGRYRLRLRPTAAGRKELRTLRRGQIRTLTLTVRVRIDGRDRTTRQTLRITG
jgi:hypothetical protein